MDSEKGEMFTVNVTTEEVVAAVLPIQEHWLPLSNLDLLIPPLDVGVFFCYKDPGMTFSSMVGSLKSSLSQALVSYYAFAGEVVQNSMGEPELLCNNRGVDFVEAEADVELQRLNLYNPDQSVQGKLVPKRKHGVLAVQATWLKCGGIVVACTFDHRIADAYSTNMFLVSWAEIARPTKPTTVSTQPCFRRSLVIPRRPLSIHPSIHDMYFPVHTSPQLEPKPEPESEPLISRIYYITAEQIKLMQSLASSSNNKSTKFESFSAFLWKMVASAAASSSSSSPDRINKRVVAKIGVPVDGRKRLSNGDDAKEALMGSYFGNMISTPFGAKPVEELVEKPLSWVAEEVHKILETALTKEHFLGLIDWVEAQRPTPVLSRFGCGSTDEVGPSFVVSSGQRFPESKIDFGWGKPFFGSYYFPWDSDSGYVMPMPSPKRNGDWVVYMHLFKGHFDFIESAAAHIFRPLSWDYLNNNHQH